MEELFITEQELEYFINIPGVVCEEGSFLRPQRSFEEEAKDCITLEEFSDRIGEAIGRLIIQKK